MFGRKKELNYLEGFQASPSRLFDKDNMKVKALDS
jgi:hypothetical protein